MRQRFLLLPFLTLALFFSSVSAYSQGFSPLNVSPVIDSIGPQNVFEGDTLDFRVTASDADEDSIVLSAEGIPANATFIDSGQGIGRFTFTPDFSQEGEHEVTFIASDGILADSEVVIITVAQEVSISVDSASGKQGTTDTVYIVVDNETNLTTPLAGVQVTLTYDGEKIDAREARTTPRSSRMAIDFVSGPDSIMIVMFSPALDTILSGTGPIIQVFFDVLFAPPGNTPLHLKEVFLFDKDAQAIPFNKADGIFTIIHNPLPPNLSIWGDSVGVIGDTLGLLILAADPNGDSITLSVDNLPDSNAVFVDSGNGVGVFTFAPDSNQVGDHLVLFYASDGALADTEAVVITVAEELVFVRGDANADGFVDLYDALRIVYWLGGEADTPPCINAADVEDDEEVDLYDALRVVYWLGGEAGPPPTPCCVPPGDCGVDPTPGELSCDSYPPCGWNPTSVAGISSLSSAAGSRLMVEQAVVEKGTATVPIILTNAEPLIGFNFTIEYEPELLTARLVGNAGLVTEGFDLFVGGVGDPGFVKVVGVRDLAAGDGVEKLPAGERQVAWIVFEVGRKPRVRDIPLKVTSSAMAISHDRALSHRTVDGMVRMVMPETFGLSQNSPNPFNPTTAIDYDLPMGCRARLEVFNTLGQRVCTLIDEWQAAGHKSVEWDGCNVRGEDVPSGVYFYRLEAGDFKSVRRMVLLR